MTDLKAERKRLGLTQAELAALAGVGLSAIVYIERGKHKPRKGTLEKIETAILGIEPIRLTNGDMVRRKMLSNSDLIKSGRVPCPGDRSACSGSCLQCKTKWLRQPYTAKE